MNNGPANCKHVFLDIVGYSKDRTVEAQTDIIAILNNVVKNELDKYKRLIKVILPTGDGMCISFINNMQYDIGLVFALGLLDALKNRNDDSSNDMRRFNVRIGINENTDNIIVDINNRKNIAGSGINYAQRIMSIGDDSMIMVGSTVYEQLNKREKYFGKFKKWYTSIKHDETIAVYQYIDNDIQCLNCSIPKIFIKEEQKKEEIKITDKLAFYLVLINKGIGVFGKLMKDPFDTSYFIVLLFYLADYVNDYYQNTKKIIKSFSGNFLDSLSDDGRNINVSKAFKELKAKQLSGLMIGHLAEYIKNILIDENYARALFIDANNPLQLSELGDKTVNEELMDQYDFVNTIT